MPVRPIKRSKARLLAGRVIFTLQRYGRWLVEWPRLARTRLSGDLPYVIAEHRTPLRRAFSSSDERLTLGKINNLKLAIRRLDGVVLEPGKTFSYWFTIGNPTVRHGYLPGLMLKDGQLVEGIGGGLCQMSNLIYWLTLHTPLTVVERWRHGYDVFPDASRTQPFGSGATCYYPFLDLVIENPTSSRLQLRVRIDGGDLVGEWRSSEPAVNRYEVVEREHAFEALPWGGWLRKNKLVRRVTSLETGAFLGEDVVANNEAIAMYEPLIETSS